MCHTYSKDFQSQGLTTGETEGNFSRQNSFRPKSVSNIDLSFRPREINISPLSVEYNERNFSSLLVSVIENPSKENSRTDSKSNLAKSQISRGMKSDISPSTPITLNLSYENELDSMASGSKHTYNPGLSASKNTLSNMGQLETIHSERESPEMSNKQANNLDQIAETAETNTYTNNTSSNAGLTSPSSPRQGRAKTKNSALIKNSSFQTSNYSLDRLDPKRIKIGEIDEIISNKRFRRANSPALGQNYTSYAKNASFRSRRHSSKTLRPRMINIKSYGPGQNPCNKKKLVCSKSAIAGSVYSDHSICPQGSNLPCQPSMSENDLLFILQNKESECEVFPGMKTPSTYCYSAINITKDFQNGSGYHNMSSTPDLPLGKPSSHVGLSSAYNPITSIWDNKQTTNLDTDMIESLNATISYTKDDMIDPSNLKIEDQLHHHPATENSNTRSSSQPAVTTMKKNLTKTKSDVTSKNNSIKIMYQHQSGKVLSGSMKLKKELKRTNCNTLAIEKIKSKIQKTRSCSPSKSAHSQDSIIQSDFPVQLKTDSDVQMKYHKHFASSETPATGRHTYTSSQMTKLAEISIKSGTLSPDSPHLFNQSTTPPHDKYGAKCRSFMIQDHMDVLESFVLDPDSNTTLPHTSVHPQDITANTHTHTVNNPITPNTQNTDLPNNNNTQTDTNSPIQKFHTIDESVHNILEHTPQHSKITPSVLSTDSVVKEPINHDALFSDLTHTRVNSNLSSKKDIVSRRKSASFMYEFIRAKTSIPIIKSKVSHKMSVDIDRNLGTRENLDLKPSEDIGVFGL